MLDIARHGRTFGSTPLLLALLSFTGCTSKKSSDASSSANVRAYSSAKPSTKKDDKLFGPAGNVLCTLYTDNDSRASLKGAEKYAVCLSRVRDVSARLADRRLHRAIVL